MTYVLRFLPQVEMDAADARLWYEQKSTGLGNEFLLVFYARVQELARNPLACQQVHRDFRRILLRRFPYAVYYRVDNDRVIVVGLFPLC